MFEKLREKARMRRKMEGIARATSVGMRAVINRFDLPEGEALKVFGLAYANSLAEDAGSTADELFGADKMSEFQERMDKGDK